MADTDVADTEVDPDSIGPQLDLDDVTFPAAVADGLATAYGVDGTIETGAEWVSVTRRTLSESDDRTPTVEDLCTSADGRHTFAGSDESQSYICVLDPLAYPFLTDTPGTIRSETPVRGETVEVEVSEDGATVSHDDAVISLGVAEDPADVEEVTPAVIYQEVCGYIHVFADRDEYEEWTAAADGVTTAVPARDGVGVARELALELFG